jgi:hypothetical protein
MAFSAHDIVSDSPTNNFCTLNPLGISTATLSDGNLKAQQTNAAYGGVYFSTFSIPKIGKYYIECLLVSVQGNQIFGLYNTDTTKRFIYDVYYSNGSGRYYTDGTAGTPSTGGLSSGTIIAIYIDSDSLTANFFINNNILSSPSYSLTPDTDYFLTFNGNNSGVSIYNFGQDPTFAGNKSPTTTYTDANGIGAFYYQPPTDALALCTANLPDFTPTVTGDTPQDYFKTVLYTGDGSNNRNITSVGFQPDFVWLKARNQSYNHYIFDAVRGAGYVILSNQNFDEENLTASFNSFDSDGFTVSQVVSEEANQSNTTYVVWCMKAGGPPDLTSSPTKPFAKNGVQYETLSAANITAGTITPTAMSVNTDAGFSIVKYGGSNTTGLLSSSVSSATIPHGLNDCEFCIIKNIRWSNTWVVSHRSIAPNVMALQSTGEADPTPPVDPTYGQITTLGSNTVTITRGTSRGDNVGEDHAETNGQFEYIMYCWHSVENYSKFGSYTGNGSADGPFIYCGFRPAFVICKCSSDTTTDNTSWAMFDNARDSSNVMNKVLYANSTINEGYRGDGSTAATDIYIDFLSNGFKVRSTKEEVNDANETYIFMAFAEQPFKFSNAR